MNETDSTLPPLLARITHPSMVADLSLADKQILATELRQTIIRTVAANGGHLAPSLGVVELTLALLSVFDPEEDKLVWDVGHQSYAWKLLTGRSENFHTLRQLGGISGFPKIEESPFDHFGVGHSSTSVSAALGMAMARDLAGKKNHVLAVIGDGSLTGGLAFEGLNQAGDMGRRLIVVLNDNEMSISHNVGALSLFLSRNMERGWARRVRREVKDWLKSIPGIGDEMAEYAHRTHRSLKTVFTPGMLFEALRFNYIGPVNGHNIEEVERHLRMAASIDDQPVLLHVLTRKGKGYPPAEAQPSKFHGLGKFDVATGQTQPKPAGAPPTYTDIFGETLCRLAKEDDRIVAVTAAMSSGTGTGHFKSRFPTRFTDVGICEQHAVTFAAGLAASGFHPVVAIYSTFLQRAYDQIVHDVCLQKLPVTFCVDRAGLVGEDGATHHGVFDIAYLRHIPEMTLLAPRDENMLRHCLLTATTSGGPCAVRYPRGAGMGVPLDAELRLLPSAQGEIVQDGERVAIVAVGNRVRPALEAAAAIEKEFGFRPLVFDPIWLKPLPAVQLAEIARTFDNVVFVEEGCLAGGFASAVLERWADDGLLRGQRIRRLGIGDAFVEHGTQAQLRELVGLRAPDIIRAVRELVLKG